MASLPYDNSKLQRCPADNQGRISLCCTTRMRKQTISLFCSVLWSMQSIAGAAATGTIKDVQHVVIFMQENRCFDHYFGTLKGVRGFADRNAILLKNGKSVFHQPNGA